MTNPPLETQPAKVDPMLPQSASGDGGGAGDDGAGDNGAGGEVRRRGRLASNPLMQPETPITYMPTGEEIKNCARRLNLFREDMTWLLTGYENGCTFSRWANNLPNGMPETVRRLLWYIMRDPAIHKSCGGVGEEGMPLTHDIGSVAARQRLQKLMDARLDRDNKDLGGRGSGQFMRLRQRLGLSRADMGELLGVSEFTIRSYELGRRDIPTRIWRLVWYIRQAAERFL